MNEFNSAYPVNENEIVEMVISKGAYKSVNAVFSTGFTPLQYCAIRGMKLFHI